MFDSLLSHPAILSSQTSSREAWRASFFSERKSCWKSPGNIRKVYQSLGSLEFGFHHFVTPGTPGAPGTPGTAGLGIPSVHHSIDHRLSIIWHGTCFPFWLPKSRIGMCDSEGLSWKGDDIYRTVQNGRFTDLSLILGPTKMIYNENQWDTWMIQNHHHCLHT